MRSKSKIDILITTLFVFGLLMLSFLGNCDKDKIMLFVGICVAIIGTIMLFKSKKR